jgi:hypothetical protein
MCMEEFRKIQTDTYFGYLIVHKQYKNKQNYVLFDNKNEAYKCLKIMNEYQSYSLIEQNIKLIECTLIYDEGRIITSVGISLKYDYYMQVKSYLKTLEETYDENTWKYMDGYIAIFGINPKRPCTKMDIFCCLTCLCCFELCFKRKTDEIRPSLL